MIKCSPQRPALLFDQPSQDDSGAPIGCSAVNQHVASTGTSWVKPEQRLLDEGRGRFKCVSPQLTPHVQMRHIPTGRGLSAGSAGSTHHGAGVSTVDHGGDSQLAQEPSIPGVVLSPKIQRHLFLHQAATCSTEGGSQPDDWARLVFRGTGGLGLGLVIMRNAVAH